MHISLSASPSEFAFHTYTQKTKRWNHIFKFHVSYNSHNFIPIQALSQKLYLLRKCKIQPFLVTTTRRKLHASPFTAYNSLSHANSIVLRLYASKTIPYFLRPGHDSLQCEENQQHFKCGHKEWHDHPKTCKFLSPHNTQATSSSDPPIKAQVQLQALQFPSSSPRPHPEKGRKTTFIGLISRGIGKLAGSARAYTRFTRRPLSGAGRADSGKDGLDAPSLPVASPLPHPSEERTGPGRHAERPPGPSAKGSS